MKIIYKNLDNSIAIITPTQEALDLYGIEAIARKDVPHNLPFKIVEDDVIPTDREFRNAWTIDDAELTDGVGSELNVFSDEAIQIANRVAEAFRNIELFTEQSKKEYPIYSERIAYYKATCNPILLTALLLKEEEELV